MKAFQYGLITAVAALATLTAATSIQSAGPERHEHKELPAGSGGTLTLKAMVGAIDIRTHDRAVVTFDSVLKPGGGSRTEAGELIDLVEFDYQATNGDVKIHVRWKDNKPPRRANLNARHTLLIPEKYHIDVQTSGGEITADKIDGQVAARTSGGKIRLGTIRGEVKAQTSGGNITLESAHGNVDAMTSGGDIALGQVEGNATATTSGGDIEVKTVTGHLKGSTSGGSIDAECANPMGKVVELSTSGGNIRLSVPGEFKADLVAGTSGGRVDCELPVQGKVKKNSIDGKINGGGPRVSLKTSGGNITLVQR